MAHSNRVAAADLPRGHQIGQRLHELPLDGTLEMTGAVSGIGSDRQQKFAGRGVDIELEALARLGSIDAFLDSFDLDVDDPAKFFIAERFENHALVETIHELGRELPAGRLDSDA